ncbi:acyl-CoA dehydrogenase family protein [Sorangium sp. So ce1182]|uniref:acyl-CoA dehydrogenase family protein n=1 Tax=Sorangium sp. So ce1182 TaxID=3133334 RepID=UPI003F63E5FC
MVAASETTQASRRHPATMTHAEAVERARAMADDVRARAGEAEALRRMPEATIQGFVDAGLVRLLTPRAFGGHELAFDAFADATIEIARADGSSGWCFSFLNVHSWLLATFPVEAQEDVWRKNPDARLANVNVPAGQAARVDGGYRISGDWPWASGIHHCDWAMLAGLVPAEAGAAGGPPEVRLFLIPREDWEVRDTWRVTGQRGTGSHNVVVKDRLVPQHRTATMAELSGGQSPGGAFHANPIYRLPFIAALAPSLIATIVGTSQGAYQRWRAATRDRCTMYSREQVASLSHQQIRLAEISAEIDAAELLLRRSLDTLRSGGPLSMEQRVRIRRDYAYSAVLCVRAVERVYNASGGGANYESNPIQRDWRDVHAMAAHAGINFDAAAENFGRMELGLPLNPRDPLA